MARSGPLKDRGRGFPSPTGHRPAGNPGGAAGSPGGRSSGSLAALAGRPGRARNRLGWILRVVPRSARCRPSHVVPLVESLFDCGRVRVGLESCGLAVETGRVNAVHRSESVAAGCGVKRCWFRSTCDAQQWSVLFAPKPDALMG